VDERVQRTSTWALHPAASGLLVGTGNGLVLLPDAADAAVVEVFRKARVSALGSASDGWIYAVVANEIWRLRETATGFVVDPASVRLLPMFDLEVAGDALYASIDGGGVFRIDHLQDWPSPRVTRYGVNEGIPDGRATFAWDGAGLLVMADGVRRLGESGFALDPRFPAGLPLQALTSPVAGRLWASDGLQLLALENTAQGQVQVNATPLASWRHPARHLYPEADGTLWLADDRGLVRLQGGVAAPAPAPDILVRAISDLTGAAWMGPAQVGLAAPVWSLPAAARELSVRVALPSYQREQSPTWRYRLIGERDWTRAASTELTLTGLGAGDSVVEIEAVDARGQALSRSQLALRVEPYAYETTLGRLALALLAVLLLAGSAAAWARVRTRNLQTEQRRLEALVAARTEDIRRQADQIQALSEARTRFFAHVSHEFRTPLTLILGPLNDALGGRFGGLVPALAAALTTASSSARRLLRLVSELLDLSRLAAGRFDLHVGEYDLAEQLRRELAVFATQAASRQIDLRGEGLADPLLLYYDRDQLERMVSNLLANALKFAPQGGRVVLRLVPTQTEVGIEVEDNGPGIALIDQPHVFERFYQGSTTAPTDAPGTGIGLALVKELVELHQGRVELISEPGAGACFALWLRRGHTHFGTLIETGAAPVLPESAPALVWSAQAPADATPAPAQDPLRPTVLVVDDHVELRRYLADRLGDAYRVLCASDGDEALERIGEALPDVVVSDVMMPGLDGLSLARALRRNLDSAGVPLLLLSARSHKRDIVAGLEAGADDYLTKPFDTTELIARIDALLDTRRRLRRSLLAESRPVAKPPAAPAASTPLIESAQQKFEQRLQLLLQTSLSDPSFGVAEMAQALHVDRATLFRRIRTAHQCSPSEWLREHRLQLAESMLRARRGSVSEIAYAAGFDNLSYFSQAFRKRYGVAPSACLGTGASAAGGQLADGTP
jgi:signal transduction histidine kinase/DNA-binding response OmpR family regulator